MMYLIKPQLTILIKRTFLRNQLFETTIQLGDNVIIILIE